MQFHAQEMSPEMAAFIAKIDEVNPEELEKELEEGMKAFELLQDFSRGQAAMSLNHTLKKMSVLKNLSK